MEDIFVIKSGLDVNDKIVLEGVRQVRDGEKVEYEFRKPEEALEHQKYPRGIATASRDMSRHRTHARLIPETMFTKILYRPALAIVISIILLFLGVLGIKTLPIAQFPDIAPPTVMVSISYPGASANVLVESVLIPLEQSINGVQNMRFITSSATSAGEAAIIIYFEPGTDPNINVVNVQNRVNIVLFQLPPLVVREGILVSQVVPSMLMYVNIYSTDPNADQKDLYNFANVYVMPRLKRIKGMGIPRNLGNRIFAMRVWLNPDRMRAYNLSVRRRHEGRGGTEHDRFARTARPGHGQDVAIKRIRADLYRALQQARAICKHHSQSKSRWRDPAAQGRRRGRVGPQFFDIYSDINGHPAASIVLKQPRLQRRRGHRGYQDGTRADQEGIIPSRHGLRIRLRRLQISGRLDRKGAAHPARGVHFGVSRGLHVPRGFAIHADPDPRGSGVAGRDFLCLAVDGSVDQPDHALRDGSGDWRRGGRCDRGGRGGACQDGRRSTYRPTGRPWRSCTRSAARSSPSPW